MTALETLSNWLNVNDPEALVSQHIATLLVERIYTQAQSHSFCRQHFKILKKQYLELLGFQADTFWDM